MKRRFLSILLTACLLVGLLPAITPDVHAAGEHVHCDCAGKYVGVGEHTACEDHVW